MKNITKIINAKPLTRCDWCGDDELYAAYHDKEWGVPLHDDQLLFELLTLEGAQAGLSWLTVLRKRKGYRQAFANFDIKTVADFNEIKIKKLMNNPEIIRNRLKIMSVISNAKAIITIQKEFGSFDSYLWEYVNGKTIQNKISNLKDLPSSSFVALRLSKDLKNRGMNFVGPTICYSFMQATGMVNDHIEECFRFKQLY